MPSLRSRDQEIRQRLLMLRVDLHQDDVLGIVLADDELAHQLPVGIVVVAAEINSQVLRKAVRLDILSRRSAADSRRGKGRPAARPASARARHRRREPVRSRPARTSARRLVGNVVFARDGRIRDTPVVGIVYQLRNQFTAVLAPCDRAGAWGRSTASRRRGTRYACRKPDRGLRNRRYFSAREVAVEFLAKGGNHLMPR